MDCSIPGFPVLRHILEFAHTHVHWVSDAIQKTEWIHKLLKPHHVCVMDSNHRERGWSLGDYAGVTTASVVLLFGYQTAIPLMPSPGVYSLRAMWEGAWVELKICSEFAIIWPSLFRPQLTQLLDNLWWRKRTDQEWKKWMSQCRNWKSVPWDRGWAQWNLKTLRPHPISEPDVSGRGW